MTRGHQRSRAKRTGSAGYLITVIAVLGAALVCTFVLGRSYSQLAFTSAPFDRLPYVSSFDPVEDVTLGLPPDSTNQAAQTPAAAIRAIQVNPRQTVMLSGGRAVRIINVRAPRTLSDLVAIIRNRQWIGRSSGTVTLNCAVLVEHGASMSIAAPVTSGLVLTVRPGVFLAAVQHGTLRITGVSVRASDRDVPDTFSPPSRVAGRPFLLASQDSAMVITDSTFSYLGRDWNSSYGLTWSKGSTGSVRNSTFNHDFIGVYTNDSNGLRVTGDKFYYCSLYGIDPHSGSSGLLIEYDTADFNGRHGIILSDHVTGSIIQYDTTEGNGLNGIMMDDASTGNVIRHNVVTGNGSDGVVLANSGDNTVADNTVSRNRVGITVRGDTTGTNISGNTITGNKMASQGVPLAGNTVYGNGGQWRARRIGLIWLTALALLAILLGLTGAVRSRHRRRIRMATAVGG
jgi:poly(beta-D-mannuronate) C5 epimerase